MRITWLGHSGFRIEIGGKTLLIDPWITGNPIFPDNRRSEAIADVTHVLVSHGHADHISDAPKIAAELGVPVLCKADLASWWSKTEEIDCTGFNNGGTIRLDEVSVTMVAASHSSSMLTETGPVYLGAEAGFMIEHGGRTIYFSGDTDVMADMAVFEDLHRPEIGLLCAGGHYTMDMQRAAYAANRFFNFKTVIPCHYRTFPLLEQSAEALKAALPGVDVVEPEVLKPINL
jgi:L-ascorbate metabolism protein UlaG (beta-lactamase superfamily)